MRSRLYALILVSALLAMSLANADPAPPSNVTATRGNVTQLDATGFDQETDSWQGFYGTIAGDLVLSNADNDSFYNWNIVDAMGEVLAARYYITDWTLINCSTQQEIYEEEERLNILNSSLDGINDTFTSILHPDFDVAGRPMTGCRSTKTNNETTPDSVFWNVILNTNSSTTVYASLIDNDKVGFNGSLVDFQLLIPVDKATGQSFYYIYVELG